MRVHAAGGAGRAPVCGLLLLAVALGGCASTEVLVEASGIVRVGDSLALVSDERSWVYTVPIPEGWPIPGTTPFRGRLTIESARLLRDEGSSALDLESLDVLPSGDFLVLSERSAALVAGGVPVATYPPTMDAFGGVGLEGLAVAGDGRIATLWEGGFVNRRLLTPASDGVGRTGRGPFEPLVCVHRLSADGRPACLGGSTVFSLRVPAAPDPEQAFRAPDLVWSRGADELIVLLSSTNATNDTFRFKWLQRFTLSGSAVGEPLNLCDRGLLPDDVRGGREGNFEGLAWFDAETLMLVNDSRPPTTVVLIDIAPWPSTNPTVACDSPVPG